MAEEAQQAKTPEEGCQGPHIELDPELCKGCQLCIAICPKGVIAISDRLNSASYHPAYYLGSGCTACGFCFYACPEPGAIRVVKP